MVDLALWRYLVWWGKVFPLIESFGIGDVFLSLPNLGDFCIEVGFKCKISDLKIIQNKKNV